MIKSFTISLFLFSNIAPAFAGQADCARIAKQAEGGQSLFSPVAGYEVQGKGRLYFHSAPDKRCITQDVFVIPGDSLIAYTEYQGWFSVMYINPKTGKDFQGWVQSGRLKYTGTMGSGT